MFIRLSSREPGASETRNTSGEACAKLDEGDSATYCRQSVGACRARQPCQPKRAGGPALSSGPTRAHPQHSSNWSYAPAALCAREAGHDRPRPRRLCSRTLTPIFSVRSHSTCTQYVSPRASCGATRPPHVMRFMSICGTTTLNQPDPIPWFESLAASPHLSRDAEEPVFAEPSQAQAFALAVKLSEQGHFTWKEWAAALADELKATSRGEPDDDSRHYHHAGGHPAGGRVVLALFPFVPRIWTCTPKIKSCCV